MALLLRGFHLLHLLLNIMIDYLACLLGRMNHLLDMELLQTKQVNIPMIVWAVTLWHLKDSSASAFLTHVLSTEFTPSPILETFESFTTVKTIGGFFALRNRLRECKNRVCFFKDVLLAPSHEPFWIEGTRSILDHWILIRQMSTTKLRRMIARISCYRTKSQLLHLFIFL